MNKCSYSLQARVAFFSQWFRGKVMGCWVHVRLQKPLSDVEQHPNVSQL